MSASPDHKEQPFLCFCCLSAICKKWKLSTTFINFIPSLFSGFYKEEYQIHYRVSKVSDETQAPSSQYTQCIPRLIVPQSSESDILINCNNFRQLYQWVAPKYVSIQISSELCFTNISRHTSEIFTSRSKLQVLCYLIVCTYCHLSAVPVY